MEKQKSELIKSNAMLKGRQKYLNKEIKYYENLIKQITEKTEKLKAQRKENSRAMKNIQKDIDKINNPKKKRKLK